MGSTETAELTRKPRRMDILGVEAVFTPKHPGAVRLVWGVRARWAEITCNYSHPSHQPCLGNCRGGR